MHAKLKAVLLLCLFFLTAAVHAQDFRPCRVETDKIPDRWGREWLGIAVTIEAEGPLDRGNFPGMTALPRVGVELRIAMRSRAREVARDLASEFVFFTARAALIAVEPGRRNHLRFYLPPEAITLWGMEPLLAAWTVELVASGEHRDIVGVTRSANLADPAAAQRFDSFCRSGDVATEGMLRASCATPAMWDQEVERRDAPPTTISSGGDPF